MRAIFAAAALAAGLTLSCSAPPPDRPPRASTAQSTSASTSPSGSTAALRAPANLTPNAPIRPDSRLTPGATLPVTADDICVSGYSSRVRDVPSSVKREAYLEYGITEHAPGDYEIDHLISLELGGSNSLKNLWPQSYRTTPWNAHVKDAVENRLHEMVCAHEIDLATAQHKIATDWIAAYKKYIGDSPSGPGRRTARREHRGSHREFSDSQAASTPADSNGGLGSEKVWVNTRSGKYFRAGTRYYGNTKQGEYMSEQQAIHQGYDAARSQ